MAAPALLNLLPSLVVTPTLPRKKMNLPALSLAWKIDLRKEHKFILVSYNLQTLLTCGHVAGKVRHSPTEHGITCNHYLAIIKGTVRLVDQVPLKP
jgi:hypothetical protein